VKTPNEFHYLEQINLKICEKSQNKAERPGLQFPAKKLELYLKERRCKNGAK
jgi:hypothetical protein